MTLPPRPPRYINFFKPFLYLAGDQLAVPIGASHISLPLQEIQSREREKKENKRTKCLGLTQMQKGSYVTLCMCRLTLAWVSSENSTTLLECRLILTWLPSLLWTSSHLTGLSAPVLTGHSRHPLPIFLELLCPTLLLAFPSSLPVTWDLESKTLCLVSRTTYIVLQKHKSFILRFWFSDFWMLNISLFFSLTKRPYTKTTM